MEVWLEQKSLAKLQKDIDRASTELLDVKRYFGTVKGPYRVGPISGRVGRSLLHTLVLRWGLLPKFCFRSIIGIATELSKIDTLSCSGLPETEALVSDYFDWFNSQVHWELDSMAQFFG